MHRRWDEIFPAPLLALPPLLSFSTQATDKATDRSEGVEKETHWVDALGRVRLRKRLRSISDAGARGAKGKRVYSLDEKKLIMEAYDRMQARTVGKVDYAALARDLQAHHPAFFGKAAVGVEVEDGGGICRQSVRTVVMAQKKAATTELGVDDCRGRPPALSERLMSMILATFTAVVSTRATLFTAPLLQPIAVGVIIAAGCASMLHEGRRKRGRFCCGLHFVQGLMHSKGWKCVKPQGDARKLPDDWRNQRWMMVLRLAYFVFVHDIPKCLVINADHTGIHYVPQKGKMWITKEAAEANDKSVASHGDKRQFTLLATSSAEGETLPHQVVVTGKTVGSLPSDVGKYSISLNGRARNSKARKEGWKGFSVCFLLSAPVVKTLKNIVSFCTTKNHWSDDITSKAFVRDIAVPYFKKKVSALHAVGKCKPFGEQVCVLIIDCWWGWLDIVAWIKAKYRWIRLLFVPARCTPVAQPMDRGIIAKIKGKLRTHYNKWVVHLTLTHLGNGGEPEGLKIPSDWPTLRYCLFTWLSHVVDELNADDERAGVAHCWEETQLLRAWERAVQVEAAGKALQLFPKLAKTEAAQMAALVEELDERTCDDAPESDEQAGYVGASFVQLEDEEEWVEWVDWDSLSRACEA